VTPRREIDRNSLIVAASPGWGIMPSMEPCVPKSREHSAHNQGTFGPHYTVTKQRFTCNRQRNKLKCRGVASRLAPAEESWSRPERAGEWVFTECSLIVHRMFTAYSPNDHWTFTKCSLDGQQQPFTESAAWKEARLFISVHFMLYQVWNYNLKRSWHEFMDSWVRSGPSLRCSRSREQRRWATENKLSVWECALNLLRSVNCPLTLIIRSVRGFCTVHADRPVSSDGRSVIARGETEVEKVGPGYSWSEEFRFWRWKMPRGKT
jgi:hypothetical protein